MRLKTTLFALLFALTLVCAAPTQVRATERVEVQVGLVLIDENIFAEAYYNGSSFSGGGIMSALAIYFVDNGGDFSFEYRNVTLDRDCVWRSSDPSIYDVEFGNFVEGRGGLPDGLYIYGGDSTSIGRTIITVTYGGFTATGSITFWAD